MKIDDWWRLAVVVAERERGGGDDYKHQASFSLGVENEQARDSRTRLARPNSQARGRGPHGKLMFTCSAKTRAGLATIIIIIIG